MDMEFVTPPSREPASMDMGLSIEPKTIIEGKKKRENG
jgi:hypothetical protein